MYRQLQQENEMLRGRGGSGNGGSGGGGSYGGHGNHGGSGGLGGNLARAMPGAPLAVAGRRQCLQALAAPW